MTMMIPYDDDEGQRIGASRCWRRNDGFYDQTTLARELVRDTYVKKSCLCFLLLVVLLIMYHDDVPAAPRHPQSSSLLLVELIGALLSSILLLYCSR